MPTSDLYNFREQRFQPFSHSLRVYIFGVEVSKWLKGSVSITYGNRDSYNTASFDLSNPNRLWQISKANLDGIYRNSGAGEYSELAKKEIMGFKTLPANNPEISLDIKQSAFQASQIVTSAGASVDQSGNVRFVPPADGNERKYRLAVNDCIFNKHDPIRIFVKNPLSNAQEWVEVFCGFVQEHPITTNYLNGESSLRVSCYCIRQMLTKTRVQMNSLIHGNDPTPILNAGFFQDFAKGGIGTTAFGASSLEETIKQLILGTTQPTATSDPLAAQKSANGVGQFKMGNVVCYDPANPGNTLERWHLMTIFGVNKIPFPSATPDTQQFWLSNREMEEVGKNTKWTPEKGISGPDGRYLHFLLPIGGTGAGTLIQSTVDTTAKEAEWTSRWDIIRDYASKLDFQVLTSPSGDLLVEFPLYGFTPATFRRQAPSGGLAFAGADDPGKFTGLESLLTFDIHQKEETLNDEAEDFPTVLQVNGGVALTNANTEHANYRSYVYSPVLAARYGVIVEQCDFPFAGQSVGDTGDDAGGVITKRLSKLGMIEFTKRMADASSWAGSVVYRPFLFPNRPIYLKRSARIGNLTSVSYTWNVGKDASCSVGLNQLMAERYNPTNKTSTFRLLTGAVNTPISYASIWGPQDSATQISGVASPDSNNAANSKDVGSNPDLPNTTGETRPNTTAPKRNLDTNTLYPGLRELLKNLTDSPEFSSTGGKVVETFRNTERAAALNQRTMSQFGLGVTIQVKDEASMQTIQGINNNVNNPPMVVSTFNKSNRTIEFIVPTSWMTYDVASSVVQKNSGQPDAYKHVWKIIDARTNRTTETQNNVPLSAESQQLASRDLADTTKPADPCKPKLLETSGGL